MAVYDNCNDRRFKPIIFIDIGMSISQYISCIRVSRSIISMKIFLHCETYYHFLIALIFIAGQGYIALLGSTLLLGRTKKLLIPTLILLYAAF